MPVDPHPPQAGKVPAVHTKAVKPFQGALAKQTPEAPL